jgi:hypothetical protein
MVLNESAATMLIYLLAGHALADYPLQNAFLASAKNRWTPIPGVPWYQCMAAHCLIHAGVVALVTGVWWLGVAEFVIHFATDDSKCTLKFGQTASGSFNIDQAIHYACKLAWWAIAMWVVR